MVEQVEAPKIKQTAAADAGLMPPIRARFREARIKANFSQKQAADAAGVSIQAISQFERGASGLQLACFVTACDAMQARVEWVLKGVGAMFEGTAPIGGSRNKRAAART